MIQILRDKTFMAIKDNGLEVQGSVSEGLFKQVVELIESTKTEEEIKEEEKEREKERLIKLINDKLTDDEKWENKHIYPILVEGLSIVEGDYYQFEERLFKAKNTLIYSEENSPLNNLEIWQEITKNIES